jgi:hypothetical protein
MDIIKYKYRSGDTLFEMKFDRYGVLKINCVMGDNVYTRIYDLNHHMIDMIDMDGEYVYLYKPNMSFIQLKFEYGSCIVIDEFDSRGEFVDSIGCHDFNDEVEEGKEI